MTTRVFTSPLFLGFDHLEQILERASKTQSEGYPPYNIEQTGPSGLRISLAVAGFSMEELQITHEDNQLVIRGRQSEDTQGRTFLYRGIASRQFQRAFVLAEGIEIKGAWLNNGLLHIDLIRPQPESRVRTIPIDTVAKSGGVSAAVPPRPRRDVREVAEVRHDAGPQVGIARIVGEQ
ncbi:Hsp20 family protein [Acidisoma cladoniae]|jgi:HSP20 family molecular chaperone IbpA|uniref:Hsp20 family protein n=1 Tax=Acidisoma cladoniae TaxID=3040935 RepID=UPI00254EFE4E|nr:Hsp20 family protein [Acidisoma sp. PAMC 29798]